MKIGATVFALLLACASPARQVTAPPDAQKLYKWFDAVRTGQFVKLTFPGGTYTAHAFVAGSLKAPAGLVYLDLLEGVNGREKPASLQPGDLEAYAKGFMSLLVEHNFDEAFISEEVTKAFVLARACEARNCHKMASELFEWASSEEPKPKQVGAHAQPSIMDAVCEQEMFDFRMGFVWPEVDYARQLTIAKRIARAYRGTSQGDEAKSWVASWTEVLAQMPDGQKESEVDHLIRLLPVENARYGMDASPACEVFASQGASGPGSPAHKLAEVGLAAVPKLICALTDRRPTLSVGTEASAAGVWTDYRLTVGDVAMQTLT